MKRFLIILSVILFAQSQLQAQDNVAEIAHSFIKAIKTNDIKAIEGRFLDVNASYAILPKESAGMNAKQKNEKYIKPLIHRFSENFEKIQQQIKDEGVNVRKIDLQSYKLEKMKGTDKVKPIAMSIFFKYNNKERLIPVSVVEIDERWYIMEILYTTDLFK